MQNNPFMNTRNWNEPDWLGRDRIVTREGEIDVGTDKCHIVRVEYKRDHGWDIKWFAWFGPFQLFNETQFWTVPVLSQSFLTGSATGATSTWTYDPTWNNSDNSIECLGAGGGGALAVRIVGAMHCSGGGGGAYTRQNNVVVSADTTYRVGRGITQSVTSTGTSAAGLADGDTWWNDTVYPTTGANKVGAKGGGGGNNTASASVLVGGTGGAASAAYPASPTAAFSGGNGGGGNASTGGGSGGGGAAGPTANGSNGITLTLTSQGSDGGAAGTDTSGTAGAGSTNGTTAPGNGTYWGSYGSGGGSGGQYGSVNATVSSLAGGNYGGGSGGVYNAGAATGGNASATADTAGGGYGLIVLTWTPASGSQTFNMSIGGGITFGPGIRIIP